MKRKTNKLISTVKNPIPLRVKKKNSTLTSSAIELVLKQ